MSKIAEESAKKVATMLARIEKVGIEGLFYDMVRASRQIAHIFNVNQKMHPASNVNLGALEADLIEKLRPYNGHHFTWLNKEPEHFVAVTEAVKTCPKYLSPDFGYNYGQLVRIVTEEEANLSSLIQVAFHLGQYEFHDRSCHMGLERFITDKDWEELNASVPKGTFIKLRDILVDICEGCGFEFEHRHSFLSTR
jgi:hypothetical protein